MIGLLWGSSEMRYISCLAQSLVHGKHSVNIWLLASEIHPCVWKIPSGWVLEGLHPPVSTLNAERPAAAVASPLGPRTWLNRGPSLILSVLSFCTTRGVYPVQLWSSKKSPFSKVAVETGPAVLFTPDLPYGGILAVVLLCGLSSCPFLTSCPPSFSEILWEILFPLIHLFST